MLLRVAKKSVDGDKRLNLEGALMAEGKKSTSEREESVQLSPSRRGFLFKILSRLVQGQAPLPVDIFFRKKDSPSLIQ